VLTVFRMVTWTQPMQGVSKSHELELITRLLETRTSWRCERRQGRANGALIAILPCMLVCMQAVIPAQPQAPPCLWGCLDWGQSASAAVLAPAPHTLLSHAPAQMRPPGSQSVGSQQCNLRRPMMQTLGLLTHRGRTLYAEGRGAEKACITCTMPEASRRSTKQRPAGMHIHSGLA
jgi:hypothetical protein